MDDHIISLAIEQLIKKFEGFAPDRYLCPWGKPTIGYGHVLNDSENYKTISEEEASCLLLEDCNKIYYPMKRAIKVEVDDNQKAALLSFCYNVGITAFKNSTLLEKLNNGDIEGASKEFIRWNKIQGRLSLGLTKRRQEEKDLFLSNLA